jgi:hypothetical protein
LELHGICRPHLLEEAVAAVSQEALQVVDRLLEQPIKGLGEQVDPFLGHIVQAAAAALVELEQPVTITMAAQGDQEVLA